MYTRRLILAVGLIITIEFRVQGCFSMVNDAPTFVVILLLYIDKYNDFDPMLRIAKNQWVV